MIETDGRIPAQQVAHSEVGAGGGMEMYGTWNGRFAAAVRRDAGELHLEFVGGIGWVLRFGWDGFYRVADDSRGAGECLGSLYRMLGRFG